MKKDTLFAHIKYVEHVTNVLLFNIAPLAAFFFQLCASLFPSLAISDCVALKNANQSDNSTPVDRDNNMPCLSSGHFDLIPSSAYTQVST